MILRDLHHYREIAEVYFSITKQEAEQVINECLNKVGDDSSDIAKDMFVLFAAIADGNVTQAKYLMSRINHDR